MATIAEMQDALVNADRAGDTEAARKIADAIVQARAVQEVKPLAVQTGEKMGEIPRQLGLTARYAMEGVPQFADMLTSPIRVGASKLGLNIPTLASTGARAADAMNLPQPQGANERVVGDMAKSGFSTLGLAAPARAIETATSGAVSKIAGMLAANPAQQAAAAVGAGGAGGAVREAGGGPVSQTVAAVAGGVAGGLGADGLSRIAKTVAAAIKPNATPQQVEQTITLVLQGSGVDWRVVPERVKQGMRDEVRRAMSTGDALNPDAVRRLVDFRATNTTPTRGMLTQDPAQITREMNLAKTGANSTDIGLQALPQMQNRNASTLLGNLDELGARNAPDAYSTGESLIGAVTGNLQRSKSRIDSLYSAARDTQGRSAPLDGATFTTRANTALDEALVGGKLPPSVGDLMNRIAKGEMPFNVDIAEQLKTRIGDLQRASSDGQERMALGIVRRALDDTPLQPAPQVNPNNLPIPAGMVPPSPAVLGEESIQAFNRARAANRAFMGRVEKSPALEAIYEQMRGGKAIDPQQFVKRYVTGQGASFADVTNLRRAVANDPAALQAVKANIASALKSAATNNTEDIVKFSPASYNKALQDIGERKLSAFFSPEEVMQLQAIGRAGTLMTAQPVGSAVNNSNTGALLIGRTLDVLDRIAGKLPLGLDNTIQGTLRGFQQGQAMSVPQSLRIQPESVGLLGRLAPAAIYGGLLSPQVVNNP